MKTVQDQWESFESGVINPDAGPGQRDQMRLAFYAGAWAMFNLVARVGEHEVTEDEGVEFVEKLRLECEDFAKEYAKRN